MNDQYELTKRPVEVTKGRFKGKFGIVEKVSSEGIATVIIENELHEISYRDLKVDYFAENCGQRIKNEEEYINEKTLLENLDPSDARNPMEESYINIEINAHKERIKEYERRCHSN